MKILVVSLLRLGDVIQQAALLKGLRAKYPQAEIHLLMNQQFSNVEEVLPGIVDKYIYFDRESLQRGLGEAGYNILWPYRELNSLIENIKAQNYDLAINMTHTKLSAYLLGATEITNVQGLVHSEGRFQGLSNKWLRYFNDRFSGNEKSLFHYVELLGKSFSIPVTHAISRSAAVNAKEKKKTVLFQCLTSDVKKNWSLQRFLDLKNMIEVSLVDYRVKILGAPFEKEELLSVFSEDDLIICNLAEARAHLSSAALLVTGDTSIKHLAAQEGTPIVEISLGSSDPVKTGAFSRQTLILKSNVSCAPCVHSQACTQKEHLCGEDISTDRVFEAVWDQLSLAPYKMPLASYILERSVWSLFLDGETTDSAYEQQILETKKTISDHELSKVMSAWNQSTQRYRQWLNQARKALPSREDLLQRRQFQSADIADLILVAQDILKSKADNAGYFQGFVSVLLSRFNQPVQIYDRVNQALQEVEELINIRQTLTEYLQIPSMEGAYYAKGIGKLSISGFAEAGESSSRDSKKPGIQPRDRETTAT